MAKIKLTAQELKHQKASLRQYQRFLPILTLKKLQLSLELTRTREAVWERQQGERERLEAISRWIAVMGEGAAISEMIEVEGVQAPPENVAGVEVPSFGGLLFGDIRYDLYTTPLWVDRAVAEIKDLLALRAEIEILERRMEILESELRVTVQRVNLFEKIKIPEARENIRAIQVFLGDQQTAAVVRGKISKAKAAQRQFRENGSTGRS